MKITTFTFLFLFLFSFLRAQCPDVPELDFSNQAAIDQFIIDYPDCQNFSGNIRIRGSVINLNGLSNLVSLNGFLSIESTHGLNDISGLNNLERIGGAFNIFNTGLIIIENNFNNLTEIGQDLSITGNDYLTKINDFEYLTQVRYIEFENRNLSDIENFSSLTHIQGLTIKHDDASGGSFPESISINAFQNLTSVDIFTIDYPFDIHLNIAPFTSLSEIGRLSILGELENLEWLPSLNSVTGRIHLAVKNIETPSAFQNAHSGDNTSSLLVELSDFTTLEGLENINLNNLLIRDNVALQFCSLPNICQFLYNGGSAGFAHNAPGCNSVQEVLDNCNMSIDSHELNSKVDIYPNPVKNDLNVSIKDNSLNINKISLYDFGGKLINEFQNQSKLNLSFYPNGNYMIVLDTDKGFISKKITIAK